MTEVHQSGSSPYYGRVDLLGRFLSWWRTRAVLRHVRGELVDLACGDNRLVRARGHGLGVDVQRHGADLVVERLDRLPLGDEAADSVTIVASLNYFDDPLAVLREAGRILRRDGVLIITMTSALASAWWHRVREPWARHSGFTHREIIDLLTAAGFTIPRRRRFMLGLNSVYIARKRDPAMR